MKELERGVMKWLKRGALVLVAAYAAFFSAVMIAMLQPPERFGRIMMHLPEALVWRLLPAPRMWLWARKGNLEAGSAAPDFTLSTSDHTGRVTLSTDRGRRPVVLVFGSYT
jgi:hypothetical protein